MEEYLGNEDLLDRCLFAFFASREYSEEVAQRAVQWAEEICQTDKVVISGFHSPLEKEVLRILLEHKHPVVVALGRALYKRVPPNLQQAFDEGRLLFVSFRGYSRHSTKSSEIRNWKAAGIADEVLVQLSYAIGIAEPLSVYVDTYGTNKLAISEGEIARRIAKLFDLRPASIVRRYGLKNPIFEATASYGHFGNRPYTKEVTVFENGVETTREVEFFGWEKLDMIEPIKEALGL